MKTTLKHTLTAITFGLFAILFWASGEKSSSDSETKVDPATATHTCTECGKTFTGFGYGAYNDHGSTYTARAATNGQQGDQCSVSCAQTHSDNYKSKNDPYQKYKTEDFKNLQHL